MFVSTILHNAAAHLRSAPMTFWDLTSRHPATNLAGTNRGAEHRPDHAGELIGTGDGGVSGTPEHPTQRLHVGAGTDGQTHATGPPTPSLGQGASGVGSTVGAL